MSHIDHIALLITEDPDIFDDEFLLMEGWMQDLWGKLPPKTKRRIKHGAAAAGLAVAAFMSSLGPDKVQQTYNISGVSLGGDEAAYSRTYVDTGDGWETSIVPIYIKSLTKIASNQGGSVTFEAIQSSSQYGVVMLVDYSVDIQAGDQQEAVQKFKQVLGSFLQEAQADHSINADIDQMDWSTMDIRLIETSGFNISMKFTIKLSPKTTL